MRIKNLSKTEILTLGFRGLESAITLRPKATSKEFPLREGILSSIKIYLKPTQITLYPINDVENKAIIEAGLQGFTEGFQSVAANIITTSGRPKHSTDDLIAKANKEQSEAESGGESNEEVETEPEAITQPPTKRGKKKKK